MNGIINVYKEQDYTSFDVVAKLRRILKFRKIGHTGTLDPMATGVLPICVGKSTKVVELLTNKRKTYKATMVFGIDTDTQDITGKVLRTEESCVSLYAVEQALNSFVGDYDQIPPMYSAIKKNGKRLYELAREGIVIEREPRRVHIYEVSNIVQIDDLHFSFEVSCSKGTYIRTLIVDVANKLGTVATMTALERTLVEPFKLEKALTLDEIEALVIDGKLDQVLKPVESLFTQLPRIDIQEDEDKWLYNGNKFQLPLYEHIYDEEGIMLRMYDSKGQFVAIYKTVVKNDVMFIKPHKMFY